MILSIGAVLIAVGASRWLGLSPLISTLALGATVANASAQGDHLLKAQGRVDPPLYAAFFVLAGGIVLAAVVIFEVVGPLLTRRALLKTGEAKTMPHLLQYATSANTDSW